MSPDGESIVTGAGDETLRFWKVFPKQEKVKKQKEKSSSAKQVIFSNNVSFNYVYATCQIFGPA